MQKGNLTLPFSALPASSELHRREASAVPGSASGSGAANPRAAPRRTCSLIVEHLTHQFIGSAFFRTDVLRRCDNQLHLQTFAPARTGWRWSGRRDAPLHRGNSRRQSRDILAAQATGFIFPTLHHHHQNRHPGTDSFPGRQRAGLRAQPAVGAAVNSTSISR